MNPQELQYIVKQQFAAFQASFEAAFPTILSYPILTWPQTYEVMACILSFFVAQALARFVRWYFIRDHEFLKKINSVIFPTLFILLNLIIGRICLALEASALIPHSVALVTAFITARRYVDIFVHGYLQRYVVGIVWLVLALAAINEVDSLIELLSSFVFAVGKVKITLWEVLKAIFTFLVLVWAMRRGTDLLNLTLSKRRGVNPSALALFTKSIYIFGIIIILLITLNVMGVDLTALAFFGGALGIGLGFGLRAITSNFISGIFLLLDKSIKPGDVIQIDNTYGVVKHMNARYMVMRRRDDVEVLIPNETLMVNNVVNWSYSNKLLRQDLKLSVDYNANLDQVRDILVYVARQHRRVVQDPGPRVLITAFGDNGIDLFLRYWITDPENGLRPVISDLYWGIWEEFKKVGITIPAPQRVVYVDDIENMPEIRKNPAKPSKPKNKK
jgi:small-conductance mechanosensitive channel